MDNFFGLYFHFYLELALETWVKASLTHSLGVHDLNHTHSLANFYWSGLSDHERSSWLKLPRNDPPYKGRGVVSMPICANEGRNGLASANHGCSTASQGSHHVRGMSWISHPPPPYLTFFASASFKMDCASWQHAAKVRRRQKASWVVKVLKASYVFLWVLVMHRRVSKDWYIEVVMGTQNFKGCCCNTVCMMRNHTRLALELTGCLNLGFPLCCVFCSSRRVQAMAVRVLW